MERENNMLSASLFHVSWVSDIYNGNSGYLEWRLHIIVIIKTLRINNIKQEECAFPSTKHNIKHNIYRLVLKTQQRGYKHSFVQRIYNCKISQ